MTRTVCLLLVAAATTATAGGCAMFDSGPHAECGFQAGWTILKPPVIKQGPTATAITNFGLNHDGMVVPSSGVAIQPATTTTVIAPGPARVGMAAQPDCNLQDLCDRLARIELRLGRGTVGLPVPGLPPLRDGTIPQKMPSAGEP